ncbi:hypothetical protein [Encephalitozoon cuniculi GB-M1]|uniref:Uncharacterized protein n=1 Tax=Encephalitozoon cuniculi (strain GB-M1) TaxID=284813 RepID=Q8SVQ2_ENCCU|nr:uncharacterized protein ECU04_1570 [Encephalitozoon cuniculi GB-M1]CAD25346.1 hypothetical protein [Encephalitozoon cuniculi GB-M1]
MEKKFPTVVTIGGRRYVKNNLNRKSEDCKMKLKEALKSFGRRVQKLQMSHCTIEKGTSLHVYKLDDARVIFTKKNKPIGFVVTGKAEEIDKSVYEKASSEINDATGKPNEPGAEERAEKDDASLID